MRKIHIERNIGVVKCFPLATFQSAVEVVRYRTQGIVCRTQKLLQETSYYRQI